MERPRILIVTYNWPPRNAIGTDRPYFWAKYWSEFGCQVSVLTAEKKPYDEPLDLRYQHIEGLTVYEVPYAGLPLVRGGWMIRFKQFARLMARMAGIQFDPRSRWTAPAVEFSFHHFCSSTFDYVVSTSGPDACHRIASALKKKWPGTKWLADYRDLGVLGHSIGSLNLLQLLRKRRECRQIQAANYISTVSKGLADRISQYFSGPVIVSENGYDGDAASVRKLGKRSKFTIVYTGSIYSNDRDPSILFEAINELIHCNAVKADDIQVEFYGHRLDGVENVMKRYSASYVKVMGHVTRELVKSIQMEASLLLILESGESGVLTGKIFEYMWSGSPILCIGKNEQSDIGELLMKTGTGLYTRDESKVRQAILEMIKGECGWFQPKWGEIEKYSRKNVSIKLLKEMTGKAT